MYAKPITLAMIALVAVLSAACNDEPEPPQPFVAPDPPGQSLMSSLERELSPAVDPAVRDQLGADNRDFAFALFHQIRKSQGPSHNTFFSPHSISIALAMTYPGTSGETQEQLREALRFRLEEDELHPAFNALALDLDTRAEADVPNPPVLRVINQTWAQDGMEFFEDYLDVIALHYGSGIQLVDFDRSSNEVREEINEFINAMTEGRIEELLAPAAVNPMTRLVLTNAIYFLADWHTSFERRNTSEQPFYPPDGVEATTVQMMRNNATFGVFTDSRTHAVSLDYAGRELAFIAMKPASGEDLGEWLEDLDRAHFDEVVRRIRSTEVTVHLPSFELEGDYNLQSLFRDMGWTDFNGLDRLTMEVELTIAQIVHQSFIRVDEEGSEAAAATAVVIDEENQATEPLIMRFDRPFVYAIYDKPTDTILFLGSLMNP